MKSYNNLWNKFISEDNIRLAIKNSSKGKKKKRRRDVKNILKDIDGNIPKIIEYAENYYNFFHKPKIIRDGISKKKREIIVPKYIEQIIHHMLINVLKDILLKGNYEFAMGSIPKKGCVSGKKRIEKWIRKDRRNFKFILKLDIKHYFQSIPHDKLKAKLDKLIKDKKIKNLLFKIIDVIPKGLPLGFYTSQWLSMWYLQEFDHYVKENLYSPYYIRYVDDMVIAGSNKRKLKQTWLKIIEKLREMGLELNNRCQLFRFCYYVNGVKHGRDLDFMGFRFYTIKTSLRKSIMIKMSRKAKRIYKKLIPTIHDYKQMMSYIGYYKHCDIFTMWIKHIEPYFDIKKAKELISKKDKEVNRYELETC